ncbi:MAG: hypothetical protein ABSC94_27600, partial [Polyangiaceae bacterium]
RFRARVTEHSKKSPPGSRARSPARRRRGCVRGLADARGEALLPGTHRADSRAIHYEGHS